jgi:hypothetical protein
MNTQFINTTEKAAKMIMETLVAIAHVTGVGGAVYWFRIGHEAFPVPP